MEGGSNEGREKDSEGEKERRREGEEGEERGSEGGSEGASASEGHRRSGQRLPVTVTRTVLHYYPEKNVWMSARKFWLNSGSSRC